MIYNNSFEIDLPIDVEYLVNLIGNSYNNSNNETLTISDDESSDSETVYNYYIHNYGDNDENESKEEINSFTSKEEINLNLGHPIKIRKNDKHCNKECIICFELLKVKQNKRVLPHCNHYYHEKCIDEWLLNNSSCPICRHIYK